MCLLTAFFIFGFADDLQASIQNQDRLQFLGIYMCIYYICMYTHIYINGSFCCCGHFIGHKSEVHTRPTWCVGNSFKISIYSNKAVVKWISRMMVKPWVMVFNLSRFNSRQVTHSSTASLFLWFFYLAKEVMINYRQYHFFSDETVLPIIYKVVNTCSFLWAFFTPRFLDDLPVVREMHLPRALI